jgi:hypothetical protein
MLILYLRAGPYLMLTSRILAIERISLTVRALKVNSPVFTLTLIV